MKIILKAQQMSLPMETPPGMDIPKDRSGIMTRIKQYPDLSIRRAMEIMGERNVQDDPIDGYLDIMENYELTDVLRTLIKRFPKKELST